MFADLVRILFVSNRGELAIVDGRFSDVQFFLIIWNNCTADWISLLSFSFNYLIIIRMVCLIRLFRLPFSSIFDP